MDSPTVVHSLDGWSGLEQDWKTGSKEVWGRNIGIELPELPKIVKIFVFHELLPKSHPLQKRFSIIRWTRWHMTGTQFLYSAILYLHMNPIKKYHDVCDVSTEIPFNRLYQVCNLLTAEKNTVFYMEPFPGRMIALDTLYHQRNSYLFSKEQKYIVDIYGK